MYPLSSRSFHPVNANPLENGSIAQFFANGCLSSPWLLGMAGWPLRGRRQLQHQIGEVRCLGQSHELDDACDAILYGLRPTGS